MFFGLQKNGLRNDDDLRDSLLKIIKVAYLTQKWVRLTTWTALLLGSPLFFWLTGGLPPHGWRVLAQAMINLPELWAVRGPAVLLPLFVLFTYSLVLLLVWLLLISALLWVVQQQWLYLHTWQHVEQAAREVQPEQLQKDPGYPQGDTPTIHPGPATECSRGIPLRVPWLNGLWEPRPTLRESKLTGKRVSRPHNNNSQNPQQQFPIPPVASLPVSPVARNVRTVNLNPPFSPLLEQALQAQGGVGTMTGPLTQPLLQHTSITEPQSLAPEGVVALRVGTGLDPGITRKEKPNEDHLLAVHGTHTFNDNYRPYGLFVIADGMGGHANGQEASRLVIQHIRNAIIPTLVSNVDLDSKHSKELLLEGIQHANLAIYQQNRQQECDMGSTITAAILVGSMLIVANVGDSRTYLYNPQKGLTQVTHDHSMVARLVEKGIIGADDIYTHPQRNQIYRCLGETASVQIDAFSLFYQPGDTLLLCSDGLWEMVRDGRIQDILHRTLPDAALAAESLIQSALEGGGKDNISAIVVHRA